MATSAQILRAVWSESESWQLTSFLRGMVATIVYIAGSFSHGPPFHSSLPTRQWSARGHLSHLAASLTFPSLSLSSSTASFTLLPPQLPAPPPSSSLAPPPLLSLSPPRAELQRRGRTGCSAQLGSGGARGRPRHPPGHGATRPSSLSPRCTAGLRELGSIPSHRALAGHGGKAVPPPRAIPLPGGRPRQDGARRGWRPPPSKRGSGPRGSLQPPSCPGPAGL